MSHSALDSGRTDPTSTEKLCDLSSYSALSSGIVEVSGTIEKQSSLTSNPLPEGDRDSRDDLGGKTSGIKFLTFFET